VIDTHRPSPYDFADPGDAEVVTEAEHVVQPYSTVVLVARRGQG
jgi:hypothetical protein